MLVRRVIALLILSTFYLFAQVQDVELLANGVDKDGDIIVAKDNVIMHSKEYFVTSDRATYNQKEGVVEFFGNVNILKGKNEVSRTNYFKINLEDDKTSTTENFVMDKESEFWSQNNESCSDKKYYRTKGSVVSSCNIQDPDWKINFSSGKLNKETKFLHLYNPVFYIKNVPVLYLPYFGFSTSKERKNGLLIPEVGYIGSQGGYYKQPIYFAPYKSWDLQFDPQIRTRRGVGLYSTLRFADSPYSYGEIRGGIFNNKRKHQERLEYKNKKHYGFEIDYDRSKLLSYFIDRNFKEYLWVNIQQVNDIEYFDLKSKSGDSDSRDSLVISKINYYLTDDNHYLGAYARYYIDTDKLNSKNIFRNDETVQELPTIHYHKFLDSLFLDNLTYSVDSKYHNYTRKAGVTANQYELSVPIGISIPIFNEYASLKLSENFYATHIKYKDEFEYRNGYLKADSSDDYINHYHQISLSTDLAKPYESFFHTMNLKLDYVLPGYQSGSIKSRLFKKHKYDYDKASNKLNKFRLEDITNNLYYEDNFLSELGKDYTQENAKASLTQYVFNKEGRKFIRHSVSQGYDFDEDDLSNLNHRLDIYFQNGLTIGNKFEFSHEDHIFEKVQTYARYSNVKYNVGLRHTYESFKRYDNEYDKDNYIIFDFSLKLPDYYRLFGRFDYDLERDYTKMWRIGITKNRKCWNYSLVYQENIEPKTSSSLSYEKASKERTLYFFINFYPFGGFNYNYSKDTVYE
ncbi:lipooligosaccharide transport system, OM translocon component LptD [Campylobacter blaseri]|uniref:Uncharacterized protein n=1 Tax=Campylobacter blaseri TaxID=2042961 RepID=A0A2P8R0C6_9BACT|nr:LPS assembly protein LptD [Campylobacter blaseri]PSM51946.1 hypothetical protein CQ405_05110 [Campylobacter blaseri]PSM53730.1 hypothetical protein CRN67_05110 [Campylobacter blaseri]QKF85715.1 lipooligosaccharide transport system, OM translocon component LptD [Campylobacter blaseri]